MFQRSSNDPKVAQESTASLARMRFGSNEVTALLRTWSIPKEERPLRRLQHLISPRRRISSYAPSYQKQ
jgi:hypothetical protein